MSRTAEALIILLWLPVSSAAAESSGLTKFLDRDLREVPVAEFTPVAKAIGEDADGWQFERPWYVWKAKLSNKDRFIVFVGQGLLVVPGSSHAKVYLVDKNGQQLKTWSFGTGYCLSLTDASFEFSPQLDTHLIILETDPVGGRSIHKQYYTLKQDQLRLVRIEDEKGGFLGAVTFYRAFRHGPPVDAITHEEWVNSLASSDKACVLSALLYVGGRHMDLNHPTPGANQEDTTQAKKAQAIREDKRVRELVADYRKSENKWIKDAAEFAAKQISGE